MKRTKEDALITKKQIIEKGVELFLGRGFSTTTLDEIAQQANVTRGAIYWHFKDKLDIVKELIEEQHQRMTQKLDLLFREIQSPLAKIHKIIEEIVRNFFDNKTFRDFIELTWFKIEYSQLARLQSSKAELTDYFIENFKTVVTEAQSLGEVKNEVNATDVTVTITNMINGMYRLFFILPDVANTKERAMRLFSSYLDLIKT